MDTAADIGRIAEQLERDPAATLSDDMLAQFHRLQAALKGGAYGDRQRFNVDTFEYGWGAQTVQFAVDVVPYVHQVLLRHYKRTDDLEFVDVGCGAGAAADLFARLHSERTIFSKMNISAIDITDARERWIKLNFPKVSFRRQDIYSTPTAAYDLVFCSHVIEHVPDVEKFVAKLVDVCRGFCFVYAPYNEVDRIPAHINTITESLFAPYNSETHVFTSMGWHPAKGDKCILAVIDCRS